MKVLAAYVMVHAINSPFEDRKEALNCVSVYVTTYILAVAMI